MKSPAFLERPQLELFDRDYSSYRRHVKLLPTPNNSDQGGESVGLTDVVRDYLSTFDLQARGFRCLSIGVRAGDGASWAATAVDQAVGLPKFRGIERVHIIGRGDPSGLPEISDAVGQKTFMRLAEEHALARRPFVDSPWVRGALVLLTLAMSVGGLAAKQLIPSASPILSIAFFLPALIAAVLAVAGQQLSPLVKRGPHGEVSKLAAQLTANTKAPEYKAFVEAVAAALLSGTRARCLIVDGYDTLHHMTKKVLLRYLGGLTTGTQRSELWVIFDRSPLNLFRKDVERNRINGDRSVAIDFYELLALPAPDRRRLAEDWGHPERADYDTVGAITRGIDPTEFHELFASQMRSPNAPSYSPLDLLYLLAVTASCGGKWTVRDAYIEENFRDPKLKRNRVLALLLPGTKFGLSEIHESLRSMKKAFADYIFDVSADGGAYDISPEAGRTLIDQWNRYGLSNPRLCHLFWSLFWRDKLVNHPLEPFWIEKLVLHVLAVGSLREIGQDSADIRSILFDATVKAVEQGLTVTMLEPIPELLERGLALISDDGSEEARSQARRLRKTCWDTYTALGDDRILKTIATLGKFVESGRAGGRPEDRLESLFLETVGIDGAPHWEGNQAVRLYARLRAVWLVQTMAPFISAASPTLRDAESQLKRVLIDSAHSRYVLLEDPGSREVVNYLCASMTLWCLAMFASPDHSDHLDLSAEELKGLVDDLETIVLHANEILDAFLAADGESSNDFVDVGAVNEVIVLARGCAARLAMALGPNDQQDSIHKLTELAWWDTGPTTRSRDPANLPKAILEVEHRLDLTHVMWASFGFTQLAEFSHLRREQLAIGAYGTERSDWKGVLSSLALEDTKKGYLGLLANSIEAAAAGRKGEIPAILVSRGVNLAFAGKEPSRLKAELGLLAIETGSIFEQDFLPFLVALLAPDRKGRKSKFLVNILDRAPDPEVAQLSQALCNSLRRMSAPDMAGTVTTSLELRIKRIDSAETLDSAQQTVDLFALEQRAKNHEIGLTDVDPTLTAWEQRHDSWMRDSMLRVLMTSSPEATASERLLGEVQSALRKRAAESRLSSNSPLQLALAVARSGGAERRPSLRSEAVAVLRRHLPNMPDMLPAEAQIEGYRILIANDRERADEYYPKLVHFDTVRHERDEVRLLPQLLSLGAYFRLFLHYFETLHYWGLLADVDTADVAKRFQLPQSERVNAIRKWRESGAKVPNPFVIINNAQRLNVDYLWYGFCLINDPFQTNMAYAGIRKQFDDSAFEALPHLYRIVSQLPSIPLGIREALARHEGRMTAYTHPN